MRVLLLSFYFPPDIGPGAFRSGAWLAALQEQLAPSDEIEVLTTQPNRYASLRAGAPRTQRIGNARITRIPLPGHQSGFIDQSKAFAAFALAVARHLRGQHYDLVCATSSRLMTACLASLVARRCRAPLFLDIRDLFVDTIGDVLPPRLRGLVPLFRLIERFTFRRAQHINVVSGGFVDYIHARAPGVPTSVVANGIDDLFLDEDFSPTAARSGLRRVLYAGNIGAGQGLDAILPELARRTAGTHEYLVFGDGGAAEALRKAVAGLPNVRLMPPVPREALLAEYREADVLFLHLNDLPAFDKVLPSKLFEYLATGKPVLAGVAGHAAGFLGGIAGVSVFQPTSAGGALAGLQALHEASYPRTGFIERYRRSSQMRELAELALNLLPPSSGSASAGAPRTPIDERL